MYSGQLHEEEQRSLGEEDESGEANDLLSGESCSSSGSNSSSSSSSSEEEGDEGEEEQFKALFRRVSARVVDQLNNNPSETSNAINTANDCSDARIAKKAKKKGRRASVLDGSLSVKSLKYLHKLLCLYKLEICKHGL